MNRETLLFRYRFSLACFVGGLVFSGLTAYPLLTEIRLLAAWLGITDPAVYPELTAEQVKHVAKSVLEVVQ